MNLNRYKECLRKKYDIQSNLVDLDAIFRKYPELDPNDPDVDPSDPDQRVLLHILIEDEETELIDFILNKSEIKADPNLIDKKTLLTPMCFAIQEGYHNIVKLLVEAGADVDLPSDNMTPCQWAACQGYLETLQYLVRDAKASLTKGGDELNLYGSVMHIACLCNHVDVVNYLLTETEAHDEEYDALSMVTAKVNYGGMNVFHICARQGAIESFQSLMEYLEAFLQ